MAYATVEDLGAFLGSEPPSGAQKMLQDASDLLDDALISAYYTTDAEGAPTDPVVMAGFKRAVCQQVEWWTNNGVDSSQTGAWTSFSIEGISVTRDLANVRSRLCDAAYSTLRQITSGSPYPTALVPGKPGTA